MRIGSGKDTSHGGSGARFPSTCWSRFIGPEGDPQALETLSTAYWKPVYIYIRSVWAKSNEDAKDLTQGFFLWVMESRFLSKADPARGRFRKLVKVALDHYLGHDVRDQARQKRGGGVAPLRLDAAIAGLVPGDIPDRGGRSPDQVLEEAWQRELLARAAALLEAAFRREGRELYFAIFRDYFIEREGDPGYGEIAAKYGIAEMDVANALKQAKQRFRMTLADLVSETVGSAEDLRDEMAELFGEEP